MSIQFSPVLVVGRQAAAALAVLSLIASPALGQPEASVGRSTAERSIQGWIARDQAAGSSEVPLSQVPEIVAEQPDFNVLAKAFKDNLIHPYYQTQSTLFVIGQTQGVELAVQARVETITAASGQFRSQIRFAAPQEEEGREYWVVSDGEQVTIYDRNQNRYSISSTADFADSNDDFLIGLMSYFSLMVQEESDTEALAMISDEELAEALRQLSNGGEALNFGAAQLQDKRYASIGYQDDAEGLSLTLLLEPTTAQASYVYMTGKSSGVDVFLREQIHSRVPTTVEGDSAFRFVPPAGSSQSTEAISIDPI